MYESDDDLENGAHFKANLFTLIENADGGPRRVDLGSVLLDHGSFKFEAEIDEPRVAKLEIFRGRNLVWDKLMEVEPHAEVTISRHGPDNVLHEPSAMKTPYSSLETVRLDRYFSNVRFVSSGCSTAITTPMWCAETQRSSGSNA